MLQLAKGVVTRSESTIYYYQSIRDEYALGNGVFHHVKDADILMVLDKNNSVIVFQMWRAIQKLLGEEILEKIVHAFEQYSTLHPGQPPDSSRHCLHWTKFLIDHPEFDFRDPANDLRAVKALLYHFGVHAQAGDNTGKNGITPFPDCKVDEKSRHVFEQQQNLRNNVLPAIEKVHQVFFNVLDPKLLEEYEKVAEVAKEFEHNASPERKSGVFLLTALLVNLLTTEHKDDKDWKRVCAALAPVGDFSGGDLLLRELGLLIEAPPGSIQFIQGRELAHSISTWEGPS